MKETEQLRDFNVLVLGIGAPQQAALRAPCDRIALGVIVSDPHAGSRPHANAVAPVR
jgi:hypothetical protein